MPVLAQVNVAVMRAPLSDPVMAGFAAAFDPIMRIADAAPGFVWRLAQGVGHPTAVIAGTEHVVNVSVWRDYTSLHQFTYQTAHGRTLLRRERWFLPTTQPSTALWWTPDAVRPSLDEALVRLKYLRTWGPSPKAFSLLRQFDPDGRPVRRSSQRR